MNEENKELNELEFDETLEEEEIEEVKKIVEEKKADIGVIFPDDLEEKLAEKEKQKLDIALVASQELQKEKKYLLIM